MKKIIIWILDFILSIYFHFKLIKYKKMKEFDAIFNGETEAIEEVKIEPSESEKDIDNVSSEETEVKKRGRRKTELRAKNGKVYRVEVDTGTVVEVDGQKLRKEERFQFDEDFNEVVTEEKKKGRPLIVPSDMLYTFFLVPVNNSIAAKTKDEEKLKIGNGINKEREEAAKSLCGILSDYIAEKTKVADPNLVTLAALSALYAAPLAISYATNRKDDE